MDSNQAPTRRKEARQPGAGSLSMRRYALSSVGIHILMLSAISIPVVQRETPVHAEPLYEVALVEWPEPNYQPPTPAKKKPEVVPEKPKPKPPAKKEKAVIIPEKKVKKPAKPQKVPEPESPAPRSEEVDPSETAEEAISLGVVDQDFKEDWYKARVTTILTKEWNRPSGGSGFFHTVVQITVAKDGTILNPQITKSSGWSLFDRSAMSAILSAKLPRLPEDYGSQFNLTVNFKRNFNGP